MGHDPLGHKVARALHKRGLLTVPEVAQLSRGDLLDVDGLGKTAVARVRESLGTRMEPEA
ncbi:helix-hairpin-helix domain-containing protein [Streptomyces solisilvae]|uniref:helix-hairpin-helix domain-containing protein n=1 Tax=Streptomyces malaysiensis TaxID=92644 RepID=UPI0036CAAA81